MTDSWEDWENEDFEVPNLHAESYVKQLEERKLVEEADNELTNELFKESEDNEPLLIYKETQIATSKPKRSIHKQKQQENEKKQKELSKKIKEDKAKKIKEQELFGEVYYDDNYAEYEDKFY
jgi:hypothetical protein